MKRKIFSSLAALALALLVFAGCDPAKYNPIYDDDARIASNSDSSFASNSVSNTKAHEFTLSATMTGMQTIWRYTSPDDREAELTFSLGVSSGGKAKLVLIAPDGTVTVLTENTGSETGADSETKLVTLKKGRNRIKIVGYDAPRLELKLSADVGQFGNE